MDFLLPILEVILLLRPITVRLDARRGRRRVHVTLLRIEALVLRGLRLGRYEPRVRSYAAALPR
jgi:hypothetical protein